MIKELMYKWFGLEPSVCPVCEVLRTQLEQSSRERLELLQRALAPPIQSNETVSTEEMKPITSQYVPWRVRQQMLESEDRKQAQLLKAKMEEIDELEKEVGVK